MGHVDAYGKGHEAQQPADLSLDELIETEMREVMMRMMMMRRRRRCISTYISIFLYKCYIVHTYISIVPVGDSLL